ncbi:34577_t:CDS:1, partial [Racocetra persica]
MKFAFDVKKSLFYYEISSRHGKKALSSTQKLDISMSLDCELRGYT